MKITFGVKVLFVVVFSIVVEISSPVAKTVFLESQNWSADDRDYFYYTSQGSQIMPYTWFRALEQSENDRLFTSSGMQRFGFIPGKRTKRNKDGLPVGFAIDRDSKGYFVGLTCAACHTSEVQNQGITYRIDGGAGQIDFTAFIQGLEASLIATTQSEEKFQRFLNRVKKVEKNTKERKLRKKLQKFADKWADFVKGSTVPVKWGPARNDAFGMIFNRTTAIDLELPKNNNQPNAPVSYPFLWGASHHSVVQWNGIAKNKTFLDRLGRNVGEVLGVFGATDLKKVRGLRQYYKTTARKANLVSLEKKIRDLKAPAWPPEFGDIDPMTWSAGQEIFQDRCASCHEVVLENQQFKEVTVIMTPISELGTDIKMAENACRRTAFTGRLEGGKLLTQDPLPAQMPAAGLLANLVAGAILYPDIKGELRNRSFSFRSLSGLKDKLEPLLLDLGLQSESAAVDKQPDREQMVGAFLQNQTVPDACGPDAELMQYKARPLNGIWATAPYLHNGSVPTLADLLQPSEKRPKKFGLNFSDFDTDKVGFSADVNQQDVFIFDTTLPGNSNAGHDSYGERTFTDIQREQLVEYMKTL